MSRGSWRPWVSAGRAGNGAGVLAPPLAPLPRDSWLFACALARIGAHPACSQTRVQSVNQSGAQPGAQPGAQSRVKRVGNPRSTTSARVKTRSVDSPTRVQKYTLFGCPDHNE
jgi:hypothetical protein